jgi:hypothetical protein
MPVGRMVAAIMPIIRVMDAIYDFRRKHSEVGVFIFDLRSGVRKMK